VSAPGRLLAERVRALREHLAEVRDGGVLDLRGVLAELEALERWTERAAAAAVDGHEAFERRTRDLSLLARMGELFRSVFDLEELGEGIVSLLRETLPAERALLHLHDERDAPGRVIAQGPPLDAAGHALAARAAADAARRGEAVVVDDASAEPALCDAPGAASLRSLASAPLVAFGVPIGVVQLAAPQPGAFGPETRRLLAQVADLAAVALHQARLCEILVERGHDLQGIVTRSHDDLAVAREALVRSQRLAGMAPLAVSVAHELSDPLAYVLSTWRTTIPEVDRLGESVPRLVAAVEAAADLPRDAGPAVDAARVAARNTLAAGAGAPVSRAVRDLREALADMGEGLERIGTALGDLRGLGVRERERMRPVALGPVVEGALAVAAGFAKPGVSLESDLAPLPEVRGHRWALAQALVSLVLHAVERVGPEGALRVTARPAGPRVHVDLRVDPPRPRDTDPMEAAGLTVALEILKLHDARIEPLEDGTGLRLLLPTDNQGPDN